MPIRKMGLIVTTHGIWDLEIWDLRFLGGLSQFHGFMGSIEKRPQAHQPDAVPWPSKKNIPPLSSAPKHWKWRISGKKHKSLYLKLMFDFGFLWVFDSPIPLRPFSFYCFSPLEIACLVLSCPCEVHSLARTNDKCGGNGHYVAGCLSPKPKPKIRPTYQTSSLPV